MTVRKICVFLVLVAVFMLTACSTGPEAELEHQGYNPENDMYIVFQGFVFDDVSDFLPAEVIGELAFELQEGAHEDITDVSGAEIDHYYIWVCLGQDCLPVDPFHFSN